MSLTRRSGILLGQSRTTFFQRAVARGIDLLIVVGIYLVGKAVWPPLGPLAAAGYAALQDGLNDGQSFGKRMIGLRVVDDATGAGCSFQLSAVRNLPLFVAVLLFDVPGLWAFGLCLASMVGALEIFLIFSVTSGVRLGDVVANTLVVEHFDDGLDDLSHMGKSSP